MRGVSIHSTDPFATPGERRSPVRQLRGRLAAPVTLWTAGAPAQTGERDSGDPGTARDGGADGAGTGGAVTVGGVRYGWAGLTVSSTLVADGRPPRLLGLVDEESDLWAEVGRTGRFVVMPLTAGDRHLADRFAGIMPAPGGLFRATEWTATPYGPVLAGRDTWAGCEVADTRRFGFGLLVEASVTHVAVGPDSQPLVYYRGRYRELRTAPGVR